MKDPYMNILQKKYLDTLFEYSMLDGAKGVLVGFSGGADSSALLRLMSHECKKRDIFLKAVHIHHGIRGEEADRDARFCEDVCKQLNIEFELVKADIPSIAKTLGKGLEETARDFRYSEFLRILDFDERLDRLATAHNLDDNAETLLFNLIRGSSVAGLAAIPAVRKLGEYNVIRPLIKVSKREIIEFCEKNSIAFIHDSTNDDTVYTRNYIRHELIPAIEKLNPSFLEAAYRLSDMAHDDDECLELEARKLASCRAAKKLSQSHRAVASRAVIYLFMQVSDATLSSVHVKSILKLCKDGRGEVALPNKFYARIENGLLEFSKEKKVEPFEFSYELKYGVNRFDIPKFAVILQNIGENDDCLEKDKESLKKIYKKSMRAELKSDTIEHMLIARSRRSGDSYVYDSMTHKLKKLYNDRGFDALKRLELPVFSDCLGIVWVPGFKVADRAAVDKNGGIAVEYYYDSI